MVVSYKILKTITILSDKLNKQERIAKMQNLSWEQWAEKALAKACKKEEDLIEIRNRKEDERFRDE